VSGGTRGRARAKRVCNAVDIASIFSAGDEVAGRHETPSLLSDSAGASSADGIRLSGELGRSRNRSSGETVRPARNFTISFDDGNDDHGKSRHLAQSKGSGAAATSVELSSGAGASLLSPSLAAASSSAALAGDAPPTKAESLSALVAARRNRKSVSSAQFGWATVKSRTREMSRDDITLILGTSRHEPLVVVDVSDNRACEWGDVEAGAVSGVPDASEVRLVSGADFKLHYKRHYWSKPHETLFGVDKQLGHFILALRRCGDRRDPSTKNVIRSSMSPALFLSTETALDSSLVGGPAISRRKQRKAAAAAAAASDSSSLSEPSVRNAVTRSAAGVRGLGGGGLGLGGGGARTARGGPAVAAVLAAAAHNESNNFYYVLVFTSLGKHRHILKISSRSNLRRGWAAGGVGLSTCDDDYPTSKAIKAALSTSVERGGCSFSIDWLRKPKSAVAVANASRELLNFESRQLVTGHKFGLLYQRAGQHTEEPMFCNRHEHASLAYRRFLGALGTLVALRNYEGYSGGLDTSGQDTTGEMAIVASVPDESDADADDIQIIFHTATLMPFVDKDEQQVSRKRYIGNDIVCLVFQDEDAPTLSPTAVRTTFTHAWIAVRPNDAAGEHYRVDVVSKQGVPLYGPPLPYTQTFPANAEFFSWLLHKLVNAERASLYHPTFRSRLNHTRSALLADLCERMKVSL
jgi:Rap/ran-GAP